MLIFLSEELGSDAAATRLRRGVLVLNFERTSMCICRQKHAEPRENCRLLGPSQVMAQQARALLPW